MQRLESQPSRCLFKGSLYLIPSVIHYIGPYSVVFKKCLLFCSVSVEYSLKSLKLNRLNKKGLLQSVRNHVEERKKSGGGKKEINKTGRIGKVMKMAKWQTGSSHLLFLTICFVGVRCLPLVSQYLFIWFIPLHLGHFTSQFICS